jgi:hypothetical protein
LSSTPEIELRNRALGISHALALEVRVGDDAVAAFGIVDREQITVALLIAQIVEHGVDGGHGDVDLAGGERREADLGILHHDQLDLEPFVLEEALLLGDVERPVADPGGVGELERLGGGAAADDQAEQTLPAMTLALADI